MDMLTRPAEFVGYMEFRDRWAGEPRLVTIDEYELLALFLYQVDLPDRLAQVSEGGALVHATNQALYDRRYAAQSGSGPVAAKPTLRTTTRMRRFVDERSRTKPTGRLAPTTAALQIPHSSAVALDGLEASLAAEARRDGIVVRSDGDSTLIVVEENEPWTQVLDELEAHKAFAHAPLTCLLPQHGGRLQLEDVKLVRSKSSSG
ncbi:hypothetical protein ABH935_008612 [Catenulispora sp. GAS73]|uniref:hypothetical protein n=1 Tax=Catenulispora sp. GAS73 TaxID=3156269 RepID=UPI0035135D38